MPSTLSRTPHGTTVTTPPIEATTPGSEPITRTGQGSSPSEAPYTHNNRHSVFNLMRDLMDETRRLIRQELALLKSELSEKISYFGKSAVVLGAGAGMGFAGA